MCSAVRRLMLVKGTTVPAPPATGTGPAGTGAARKAGAPWPVAAGAPATAGAGRPESVLDPLEP